jgi:hypothetical protein
VRVSLERLREERPKYAWVVHEYFLKERPIKELAAEKGIKEHAIHCCMTRALQALHHLILEHRPDGKAAP